MEIDQLQDLQRDLNEVEQLFSNLIHLNSVNLPNPQAVEIPESPLGLLTRLKLVLPTMQLITSIIEDPVSSQSFGLALRVVYTQNQMNKTLSQFVVFGIQKVKNYCLLGLRQMRESAFLGKQRMTMRQVQYQFITLNTRPSFEVWKEVDFEEFWQVFALEYIQIVQQYNNEYFLGVQDEQQPEFSQIQRMPVVISGINDSKPNFDFPVSNQFLTEMNQKLQTNKLADFQSQIAFLDFQQMNKMKKLICNDSIKDLLYPLIFLNKNFLTPIACYFSMVLSEQELLRMVTSDQDLLDKILVRMFSQLFTIVAQILLNTKNVYKHVIVIHFTSQLYRFSLSLAQKQIHAIDNFCLKGIQIECDTLMKLQDQIGYDKIPSFKIMCIAGLLQMLSNITNDSVLTIRLKLLGYIDNIDNYNIIYKINCYNCIQSAMNFNDSLRREVENKVQSLYVIVYQTLSDQTKLLTNEERTTCINFYVQNNNIIGEMERQKIFQYIISQSSEARVMQ